MLYAQLLKGRDSSDVFHEESLRFLMKIKRRDLNGHKSISIGRTNNGTRSYGVMRLGHNQESILVLGLLDRSERRKYTTRTVFNRGRLDFDSLISGIDTVSIPESLGIDSYR